MMKEKLEACDFREFEDEEGVYAKGGIIVAIASPELLSIHSVDGWQLTLEHCEDEKVIDALAVFADAISKG